MPDRRKHRELGQVLKRLRKASGFEFQIELMMELRRRGVKLDNASSISQWETGSTRPRRKTLLVMLQIFKERGALEHRDEAEEIYRLAAYGNMRPDEVAALAWPWSAEPDQEGEIPTRVRTAPDGEDHAPRGVASEQVERPEAVSQEAPLWPTTLPSTEPYYALPQRDLELERLLAVLRDPKGRRIIAIDGLGGLGKTAMAVELGRRCLQEGRFDRVLGESAKQERLGGETIEKVAEAPAKLDLEDLLDAIARQLGRWDVPTMKLEEKRWTLRSVLQRAPCLIIVDNLETAGNARSLVMELPALLDGSRAIVTSRPRLGLDFLHALSLDGLDPVDSLVFLREEARSRNQPEILEAPPELLLQVHRIAGGAPLAMKLVVGQATALPLDVVLQNLRKAKGEIYRFIFLESWKLLSVEAQKLLIYMGTVVTSCSYDELAGVGIAGDEEMLQAAIRETVRMSLLSPLVAEANMRYSVHPLTRHFVNSDLPAMWREQGLL